MLVTMSFFFWLLLIFVHGGVGLEDCTETRCSSDGPAIRFPFRLKDRQPIHCGFPGFDLSCTKYNQTVNQTVLAMPSSSELYVTSINYTSQEIVVDLQESNCLAREIFYHGSSSPFKFVGNASLFSCPPSIVRDNGTGDPNSYHCLERLSPCNSNPGNQIFAAFTYSYLQ
ncbi:hypothetical protein M0R45_015836 [Rubus argutus]|uniref:RING-type E3 ubiquitin transferase n=1 Tax=Rubus argutus TaxID=59490 RepID=A0AAW1XQZ2_RUBAR